MLLLAYRLPLRANKHHLYFNILYKKNRLFLLSPFLLHTVLINCSKNRKNKCFTDRASGDHHVNALRVENIIGSSYKSASRTVVAQIQLRKKARRCAAKVKLSGIQKLPELKNIFQEAFAVSSILLLI